MGKGHVLSLATSLYKTYRQTHILKCKQGEDHILHSYLNILGSCNKTFLFAFLLFFEVLYQ